jgi:hypothetical protein
LYGNRERMKRTQPVHSVVVGWELLKEGKFSKISIFSGARFGDRGS